MGRLRVRDAEYHLPSRIKKNAPSLAEGTVPDFAKVQEDIVALNTWADRKVTPSLRPASFRGPSTSISSSRTPFPSMAASS